MPKRRKTTLSKTMKLRSARADAQGREFNVPVREVMVRSPVRILRELHSVLMRTYVPCESAIEYDHATVLDVRHDVVRILAQPEWVSYELGGKIRRTVPDFRVDLADGSTEFHECRTDEEAALDEVKREKAAIADACARRGIRYVEMTATEVRLEPRLSNARLIRDERMGRRSPEAEHAVRTLLGSCGEMSIGRICGLASHRALRQGDILGMALRRIVRVDWETSPVGPDTRVSIPARCP